MRLVSVNVGSERPMQNARGKTGIFKLPVQGPVRITRDGLARDTVSDEKNHGGMNQAVYLYGVPDYDCWSEKLGWDPAPRTFGENLPVAGLESARATIGDRLHVGTAVLEVTAPRIPCATLAARMGDPSSPKRFREAERSGVYCRVVREGEVREGEVQEGDEISYEPYDGPEVRNLEIFREVFEPDWNETTIRRHLDAPRAIRARAEKEEQLERLLAGKSGDPSP